MPLVNIELSELEIQMIINCIDAALETKHMDNDGSIRADEIKKQLGKYL